MNKSKLLQILIIAFIFRLVLLVIDNFLFRLPQGGADTENFDKWAFNIVLKGEYDYITIIANGTILFSSYGAFLYEIFGRNPQIWAFTMLLFGVGTVYNVYKTAYLATKSYSVANFAGWLICLYPNIAILSVLVLREAPIHFFISLSAVKLVKYYNSKNVVNLILFFVYALICTMLHSGMFAIFLGFLVATVFYNDKMSVFNKSIIILITIGGLFIINSTGIGLSKFGGSFDSALDKLEEGLDYKNSGATYPSWLILNGGFGDVWKVPLRIVAFLFAPLVPFLVKSVNHLIGVLDAGFYLFLSYQVFKKRKLLKKYKFFGMIFSIIIMLSFTYSLGSSNFGTNIRHRSKLLPILVIVAAAAYKYNNNKNNDKKKITIESHKI